MLSISAVADAAPPIDRVDPLPPPRRIYYLPMGVNLGAAVHPGVDADESFILGAEVSFVTLMLAGREWGPEPWQFWFGGYVDGLADFANERGRVSIGPELGYGLFGIDGGPVAQFGGDRLYAGGQFRLFFSIAAVVTLYGRQGFVPEAPTVSRYTEVGVLIKYPLPLR